MFSKEAILSFVIHMSMTSSNAIYIRSKLTLSVSILNTGRHQAHRSLKSV